MPSYLFNSQRPFLSFDKDHALSIMLLGIIFSVAFSGLNSLVASAVLVMLFELIFIFSFLLLYRAYPAASNLKLSHPYLMLMLFLWAGAAIFSFILNDKGGFQQQASFARLLTVFVHVLFCWTVANYFLLSRIGLDR
ncbi:MAG: hypothetical protein HRU20_24480 [Pseudomonadales bacterium]|nr:hypothetical protein [Pseudomonadales bacterium]